MKHIREARGHHHFSSVAASHTKAALPELDKRGVLEGAVASSSKRKKDQATDIERMMEESTKRIVPFRSRDSLSIE